MHKIYDEIGNGYDTTRKADPFILSQFKSLLNIESNKKYLDVACGTGNYTSEISKIGGSWNAFDQSDVMLSEAINKSKVVKWSKFDVEKTDFESNLFNGIMCSLAIHHFPNLSNAFREISRILKSTGKIVLFTATPEQMYSYWLNEYFPDMMKKSCEQMPTLDSISSAIKPHGLSIESTVPFFIEPELQDFFLYSGKQRPEIYLVQSVRDGISSFRNLCAEKELDQGLSKLQSDIESGAIDEVIKKYENKIGDYLFVVLSKS
jgi:ubiquinone/menaquinone biosynthesis C-methylase UbiE